jgi:nucleoside-diphosphate-sugar epimerase
MHRRLHVADVECRRLPAVEGIHLLGLMPVTHVDDVYDALVFCMERPAMAGRFLCAAAT